MTTVGVGVIGAGVISDAYIKSMQSFPDLKVLAIGDLRPEAAKDKAEQYGIETHGGPEAVLSHPDVEIVVNLTIPIAHVEVALAAVAAGKHVWSEKPFSLDQESSETAVDRSGRRPAAGLRTRHHPWSGSAGVAPDHRAR